MPEKVVYPYPSQFGSHAKMVVEEETTKLCDQNFVVCKDEYGMYLTEKNRLDNGVSDNYRNCNPVFRIKSLQEKLGQVIDIKIQ